MYIINNDVGFVKGQTAQLISGGRFVSMNASGELQIAQAGTHSTMPAVAFTAANIASGTVAKFYTNREVPAGTASGLVGQGLYVGCSGLPTLTTTPLLSGNMVQLCGYKTTNGLNINI